MKTLKLLFVLIFVFGHQSLATEVPKKLFPINSTDPALVSFGDKMLRNRQFKSKLERIHLKTKQSKFKIPQALSTQMLKHLKFPEHYSVYYVQFGQAGSRELRLGNVTELQAVINEAGGFGNGTVGIPLNESFEGFNVNYSVGLASIAGENPFTGFDMVEVKWEQDEGDEASEKLLVEVDKIIKDIKSRKRANDSNETAPELGPVGKKLFQQGDFKFQLATVNIHLEQNYEETHYQLLLWFKGKLVKQWKGGGTYEYPPKHIWVGDLNADNQAIMVSSTGMGICGDLVTFNKTGKAKFHTLPCGSWGC